MRILTSIIAAFVFLPAVGQDYQMQNDSIDSPVHLREVPKHNLRIAFGLAEPASDFRNVANAGLSVGVGYDLHFNKNFALSTQLQHTYNEFGINRQPDVIYMQTGDENWSATSISLGPQFSYQSGRFQLDIYTRAGLKFVSAAENVITTQVLSPFTVVDTRNIEVDDTAFMLNGGVRFNYYFRRSVQLFFEPQYSTGLGDNIAFRSDNNRQLTTGRFNNLLLSVGVKFALGKQYSNGEMRLDDFPEIED
jgi:hypothetical protein